MEVNVNKIVDKITFKVDGKLSTQQVTDLKHQVSCAMLDAMRATPNTGKLNIDCMVKNIVIE